MPSKNDHKDSISRKSVTLRVQKAKLRDVGKNIIRIDTKTMDELNIGTGDVIGVKGKKYSAGIAWPAIPQDNGLGIARFDSRLRKNTNTSIDDTIEILKVNALPAQNVVLASLDIKFKPSPSFESFLRRKLNNYPVTLDDIILIAVGISREIAFKVKSLKPKGVCIIKQDTKLLISEDVEDGDYDILSEIRSGFIQNRKLDHLKIPLKHDVQHAYNYFNDINLIHHPLPEFDFEDINLSVKFFDKIISAPICIAAITGGHPVSKKLNEILAKAAEAENIIMSVGSQRAGLEDSSLQGTFSIVREVAPNIPIIGNIGMGQVSDSNFKVEDFQKCIDMINADVMAIHLNALHELVQDKGNISYSLFKEQFEEIRKEINIPIIAKEVGAGFNKDAARTLDHLGFDGFDVGGAGGTSFAAIEANRTNMDEVDLTRAPGEVFREWGTPTPISVLNVRSISEKPIIATGGLKTGIDIAKSIVLGADIGGFAYHFLQSAMKDYEEKTTSNTLKEIKTLKKELQSSLWLMNVKTIEELKSNESKRIILGKLYQWLHQ